MAPKPAATVTPYISPEQGGNRNVPVGQTGISYAQNFIGPIPVSNTPVGAPISQAWQNMTNSFNPAPTPRPTPQPTGNGSMTEQEALSRGIDVNVLRRQGLLIENGGGGGGQDFGQQISELYAPALNLLGEQEAQIRAGYPGEVQLQEEAFGNEGKKAQTQGEQLLGDTQSEEEKYNKVIATALEDAYRAFNALNQQRRSRFGFGSSAGQAVGELAQQEFFKQQGQIGQKQAEGTQEFAKERGKIKTYVQQKLDDLDIQKKQTLAALKQNFDDRLNEIASRKADVEGNKIRDRMAVLQDTINQARGMAQQDKEFRTNLGMAAVSKMQEVAQRAFTPKEIKAVLSEFGIDMPNLYAGATTPGGVMPARNPNQNQYDQFGNLINPYS